MSVMEMMTLTDGKHGMDCEEDVEDVYKEDSIISQSIKAKEVHWAYSDVLKNAGGKVANHGNERIHMWNDLRKQQSCTKGVAWSIIGDYNVTLSVEEHSAGSAHRSMTRLIFKSLSMILKSWTFQRLAFILIGLRVCDGWKKDIGGCKMFKLIRKLKLLKIPPNKLNRSYGNLNKNVIQLEKQLKEAQSIVDKHPNDDNLKEKSAQIR
nr:RNA-directed DNA polymerase, eukaryota, reverse transcriptase zinc-binding domain protein [Tanacetum cinerariifolium]